MEKNNCFLDIEDYSETCYCCLRFNTYNGKCNYDNHNTNALVKCTVNKYKSII